MTTRACTSLVLVPVCAALCMTAQWVRADCPPFGFGDPPDPPRATVPCGIVLVGTTGGIADPLGEFSVTIRDLANNPVEGCEVEIDFGGCNPDIHVSTDQPFPGVTMECLAGNHAIVRATTDGTGRAFFRIVGGAHVTTAGTGAGFDCAEVRAGGFVVAKINVATYDLNLAGGINPVDIATWLPDLFTGMYVGRGDYNCTQTLNPADLAMLISASLASGSTQSAASYCQ